MKNYSYFSLGIWRHRPGPRAAGRPEPAPDHPGEQGIKICEIPHCYTAPGAPRSSDRSS